ncbi:MAG: FAD binding domain-containing protein [Myxococcaceae bacterium]|nr:FAD binding domain-containing protein [Myxococcaceae bacterium]
MLTLPPFQFHAPKSVAEAVALLQAKGGTAKLVAGGTDLLPNLKHRLFSPEHVVGLDAIDELKGVREEQGGLWVGAMTRLAELATHPLVAARHRSLAQAAGLVAGPQLREMGTLGGNLCLDTRCVYYNQTYFWRKALGFCLKKDGTVCHVVKSGRNCVAAASNDTATALLTLGASVRLAGPGGVRELKLDEFYVADGVANTVIAPGEVLLGAFVPAAAPGVVTAYQKLRIRGAIDYPALSVAVWAKVREGTLDEVRLAVSALAARPHVVKRLDAFAGKKAGPATWTELGVAAMRQCHPLTNINVDPAWRREMIPVLVKRAFADAA